MGEAKHTPGPWAVHVPKPGQYEDNACSVIAPRATKEETVLVCELNTSTRNPWGFPADTQADAHLIAAAPDLLAACEMIDLSDRELCFMLGTDAVEAIRAAIIKAKGVKS